jgi:DNA-binding beta-propeller fold protein YncE
MRRDLLWPLLAIVLESGACGGSPGNAGTGGSGGLSGRNVDAGTTRGSGGRGPTDGSSTGGTTDGAADAGTGAAGPPHPFPLLYPIQGSSAEYLNPDLQWQGSPLGEVTSYVVEVATSSTFGSTDVFDQTVDGSLADFKLPASLLDPGVVYYWRVTANNDLGSTIASNGPSWFSSPYLIAGAHGIGVTPDGTRLVVASDMEAGPINVVTLGTHKGLSIPTGVASQPTGVAVSPDGTQALVTLVAGYYGTEGIDGLAVIDLTTNTVARLIADPCATTTLTDVAYLPGGTSAALPDRNPDCTAMGLNTFSPSAGGAGFSFVNLQDANDPYGIAVAPNGSFALVTMELDNRLYRVPFPGTVSNLALSSYVGSGSGGVAITPDGTTAVVAEITADLIRLSDGSVTRIALLNSGTTTSDTPNTDFHNVAISPDGSKAVVVGFASVQVISLASKSILASFPASGTSVAISPDGTTAFVSDTTNGWVRVIALP